MANRTNEEQEYTVKAHFVDADGFSVEDIYGWRCVQQDPGAYRLFGSGVPVLSEAHGRMKKIYGTKTRQLGSHR